MTFLFIFFMIILCVFNGIMGIGAWQMGLKRRAVIHFCGALLAGLVVLHMWYITGEPLPQQTAAQDSQEVVSDYQPNAVPRAADKLADANAGAEQVRPAGDTGASIDAVSAEQQPASGQSYEVTTSELLDLVLYLLLTLSPLLSILGGLMYFIVRRRAIRSGEAPTERAIYLVLMIGGTVVWLWNGIYPSPKIYGDSGAGIYWGIKSENAQWHSVKQPTDVRPPQDLTMLQVDFTGKQGWVLLHHFPLPPRQGRFKALEFYVLPLSIDRDELIVFLYGENKVPFPDQQGLAIVDKYISPSEADSKWLRVRVPLDDFNLEGSGIFGICIGKAEGGSQGTIYLDDISLIGKE